jgi:serine/threonine protein kinase
MIGELISHYRVSRQLGAGGRGVVYLARDEQLGRDVAIKVLAPGILGDEEARARFRSEAQLLARLNNPYIEMVFDFGTVAGQDYIVLEYVPGQTLQEVVAEGVLAEEEVLRLGSMLAAGLEAAHEKGILHRDLKPGNLIRTSEGRLKILDFGLAVAQHKRFMPVPVKLIALLVLLFVVISPLRATSIPIKGASNYGQTPNTYGAGTNGTFNGGSFTETTICPSNDPSFPDACNLAYVYSFSALTPPSGAISLTIDFPAATSGVSLGLLFCDAFTTVPCGTLSGSPISGSLGPDAGSGQEFIFTDLSQLQNQKIALIFVDSSATALQDGEGNLLTIDPIVPQFSAAWGTSAVATPEPASMFLLGTGLLVVGFGRRKKSLRSWQA